MLHVGGDTNWFVGQSYRSTFVSRSLRNGWWAFTLRGGGNNEPDAGLFICGTHANKLQSVASGPAST